MGQDDSGQVIPSPIIEIPVVIVKPKHEETVPIVPERNKPASMSVDRLNELIDLNNMYGETNYGRFVGPTLVVSNRKPIGSAVFDREGTTFRYSLVDKSILYEGMASFNWETKRVGDYQEPRSA